MWNYTVLSCTPLIGDLVIVCKKSMVTYFAVEASLSSSEAGPLRWDWVEA